MYEFQSVSAMEACRLFRKVCIYYHGTTDKVSMDEFKAIQVLIDRQIWVSAHP